MSEQQLRGELQASARTFAQDYIRTEVRSHRASLLTSANRTVGSDSRVEKLVSYGLSGRNGVSSHISGKMQQQLQSEYGVEGEFPINTLLRGF
jgi:anti-sigma factor RsiW